MLPNDVISILLTTFAGIGGVALVVFLIWIFLPEKIEKWAIMLHKLLSFVSERHERRYISQSIENRIRRWKEKLCKECIGILPYGFKIKWVSIDSVESELKEGNLIVKMRNHRNQSKNRAYAVREYVPNTLLPKARRYVDPLVMEGIDYVISKSALSEDTKALSYFVDETKNRLETQPDFKETINELDTIHNYGRLTRILLPTFDSLSVMFPNDPDEDAQKETLKFEKLLFNLAVKKPEEDVELSLLGEHLQVAIIVVAKSIKLLTSGIESHYNRIQKLIDEGANYFYIVGIGNNISYAKTLSSRATSELGLEIVSSEEYRAIHRQKPRKFFCSRLRKTL